MAEGGDLGRLIVTIATDLSELQTGLSKAQEKVKGTADNVSKQASLMSAKMAGVFAAVGAAVLGAATAASRYGVEMEKLATMTGIGVEEIQKLGFAAKLNQSSVEELSTGLRILANRMDEASRGTGQVSQVFRDFGIAVTDAAGKLRPTNEVLLDVADVFQKLPDGAQKSALAVDLFGRSGTQLIPFLNQGKAGLEALGKEAERLGIVMDAKAIKQAAQFNDAMDKLRAATQALINVLGVAFIPILQTLIGWLTEIVGLTIRWGEVLKPIERIVGLLRAAFDALMTSSLDLLSGLISFAQKFFELLAKVPGPLREGATAAAEGLATIRDELNLLSDAAFDNLHEDLDLVVTGVDKVAESMTGVGEAVQAGMDVARTALDGFKAGIEQLNQEVVQKFGKDFGTMANFVQNLTVTMGKAITSNLSEAISAGILGTKSWTEAFKDFGKALVKALVDFIVQYIVTATVGKALAAVAAAFSAGLAAALAQAWATAAYFASVATFGGAAAAGGAALSTGVAGAKALAAASGGLTPLAEGGIVTRPTPALIGERGPEAVIPLSSPASRNFAFGDLHISVTVNGPRIGREEAEEIGRMIAEQTQDQFKRVEAA